MSYFIRNYRHRNPKPGEEKKTNTPFFQNQAAPVVQTKKEGPFFQTKLAIGEPGDSYEQEADSVANRVVNHSDKSGPVIQQKEISSIQRLATSKEDERFSTNDAREERDKEEPLKPLQRMHAGNSTEDKEKKVQMMGSPDKDKEKKGIQMMPSPDMEKDKEEKMKPGMVQRKAANNQAATTNLSSRLESAAGRGNALPPKVLSEMSRSFGTDFSHVRLHHDNEAADLNEGLRAQAFTHGSDIYFNQGKYQPESTEGRFLLAHELTHVLQQQKERKSVQRRVVINGAAMKIDAFYLGTIKGAFGDAAVTIVEKMHNNGNPPDFAFDNWTSFATELRIRTNAIKGMDTVHAGCCNYPSTEPNGYLNPTYWKRNGWMDFTLNPALPVGKEPSDAVESIFAPGAGTQLECLTMTKATEYYSLLKAMGKVKFNQKFAGGTNLVISVNSLARGGDIVDKEYDFVTASKDKLLPGDWVYFKNFKDYTTKHPGGFWQGENAIVMGSGMYRGFGVATQSEDSLNNELVNVYNTGLPAGQQKTVSDLLAEGGGLQSAIVLRPNTKKLTK